MIQTPQQTPQGPGIFTNVKDVAFSFFDKGERMY